MSIGQLTTLFGWMTVINTGLLLFSLIMMISLRSLITSMHGKLFRLSHEQIVVIGYSFLGLYKVLIIIFNLVPYLALLLVQ